MFGLIWVAHSCAIANAILQSCVFSFLVLIVMDVSVINVSEHDSAANIQSVESSEMKWKV